MTKRTIEKEGMKLTFTSYFGEHPEMGEKKLEVSKELVGIVGEADFTDKEAHLIAYKAPGIARGVPMRKSTFAQGDHTVMMPDFAVYPETTEEVQEILKVANKYKVPVVPYSGGSGLGISAPYGGIILDLKKLNRIIEIDEISDTVTVETGIYVFDLENELLKRGYELEHTPASFYCSCIGGFIGDRSAGRLSTKYGKIEQMVLGMKIVTPTGEIIETPKVPAHAIGPDLNNLFIGMAGRIGVSTEATLKIYPAPEKRLFRSFLLPDLDNGFEAMRIIMQRDLNPCLARLYDPIETNSNLFKFHLTTNLAKKKIESNKGCCYLILGFDGDADLVEMMFGKASDICFKHGAKDLGYDEGQYWWDHNLDDYYKGVDRPTRQSDFFGPDTPNVGGVFDYIVPMKYISKIWKETQEELSKAYEKSVIYGHFSHWYKNATMMYPMWYVWDLPDDPAAIGAAWWKVENIIFNAAIKYGGAFQHHHGVGELYGWFMEPQWGKAGFKLIKAIKDALDPNGIMNPGTMGM